MNLWCARTALFSANPIGTGSRLTCSVFYGACSLPSPRLRQQFPHLVIAGRLEFAIEQAHRFERFGHGNAYQPVHVPAEQSAGVPGPNRDRNGDAVRPRPHGLHRRPHARSGRQPVIHQDHPARTERDRRAPLPGTCARAAPIPASCVRSIPRADVRSPPGFAPHPGSAPRFRRWQSPPLQIPGNGALPVFAPASRRAAASMRAPLQMPRAPRPAPDPAPPRCSDRRGLPQPPPLPAAARRPSDPER